MQTHMHTYNHMHILFLRVWWPLHMCVWVFPRQCSLHTTSPSPGVKQRYTGWDECESVGERGEKLGLFPQAWLMAPRYNKDLCTGAWHPSGWSRHMQKHTWIQIHTTYVRAHNLTYLHKQYTIHQDIDILSLQGREWIYDFTKLRKLLRAKIKKQCCLNKLVFGNQMSLPTKTTKRKYI